jgi:hypothetical protein
LFYLFNYLIILLSFGLIADMLSADIEIKLNTLVSNYEGKKAQRFFTSLMPLHDADVAASLRKIYQNGDEYANLKKEVNNGTLLQRTIFLVKFSQFENHNPKILTNALKTIESDNSPVKIIERACLSYLLLRIVARDMPEDEPLKALEKKNLENGALIPAVVKIISASKIISAPDLVFLSSLRSIQALTKLLTSKDALDYLGIPGRWFITDTGLKANAITPVYSFQLDSGKLTPLGQVYARVKKEIAQAVPFAELLQNEDRKAANYSYDVRFCLFLCLYYDYFCQEREAPAPLLNILKNPQSAFVLYLKLNEHERYAYILVSSGVLNEGNYRNRRINEAIETKVGRENDFLLSLFDISKANKDNLDLCHTMMNIAAFALGTPPTLTHLYDRIFNPMEMPAAPRHGALSCTPGSAGGARENFDCYFQDDGMNLQAANVMGGVVRYRQSLNFLTWGALALGGVFREDVIAAACSPPQHYHFLNYVNDVLDTMCKGSNVKRAGSQHLRMAVFTRPRAYFLGMKLLETAQPFVQPSLYITNFLLLLREYGLNNPNGRVAFSKVLTLADCTAFEDTCATIFAANDAAYPTLLKALEESQNVGSELVQGIRKISLKALSPQIISQKFDEFGKFYAINKVNLFYVFIIYLFICFTIFLY